MSHSLKSTVASLVGLVLVSSQARAVDLLSNLSGPVGTTGSSTLLNTSRIKAAGFTMGASNAALDSVVLRLDGFTAGDLLTVELRNDTGGSDPGATVLVSFTQPAAQGAGTFDYDFSPNASFTLQASTKYWLYITMQTQVGASFYWMASSPSVNPSTSYATLDGYQFSTNSGSSYNSSSVLNTFAIAGTVVPVPEPSTVILSGLSLAAIGATGFHRRRRP